MALTSYTFMSVPDLLKWSAEKVLALWNNFSISEKVITMLCVKRPQDIPRAISTLIENNATDRAFLEIKIGDLQRIKNASNWDKVW